MYLLQLVFAGLLAGGAYALSSAGMVTIYKSTRVINFAQGAIGMVGTYVFANWVDAGKNVALGVLLGVLTSGIVGLLTFLIVMAPLRRSSGIVRMIASVGVALLLEGIAELRWGTAEQSVRAVLNGRNLHLGSITITQETAFTVAIALGFTILLSMYFSLTKIGRATEAASISRESAERLGYNVSLLGTISWFVGSAAAGVTGILIVSTLGLSETSLTLVVIYALVGALVGSLLRIWPAVVGGFLLGIVQAIIDGTASSVAGLDQAVPLVAVVVLLLVGAEAIPTYSSERSFMPLVPRRMISWPRMAALLLVAAAAVVWLNSYWQILIVQGAGLAMVCLSIVMVVGYTGQISMMQWTLGGVGAFVTAGLAVNQHWSFIPAILVGGLAASVVAFVIGAPALRLRGITIAIVTLSASITIETFVLSWFNSGVGYTLPTPSIDGLDLSGRVLSVLSLALVAAISGAFFCIRHSWYGKRLLAMRSSERGALACGMRIFWTKLGVFSAAGFLAGVGGAVWAYGTGIIQASSFDPITSLLLVTFVYLNGVGAISGGVAAGFAVAMGAPFLTNIAHLNGAGWFNVLGGIGVVSTLILHPDGALVRDESKKKPNFRQRWADARRARVKRPSKISESASQVEPSLG
jgi:branched-subunit amino acid ABC-type transport system permease component